MTRDRSQPAYAVIGALSVCHLLNDMVQSLLPAIYPILKAALALDFRHIGLITLANQLTASLLQPVIGYLTDRKPKPQSLAIGMGFTLSGLMLLAWADHFAGVLAAAALVGVGSSIFHPESSRIARLAREGSTALPSRSSRSAATRDCRSGRCWRPSSCSRTGRAACRGSRSRR